MTRQFKPEGHTSVSPYLVVEEPQRTIDFLGTVFDATELRRFDDPDGSIVHAEVRIDDAVVMLGGASEEFPAFSSIVHVYVRDVDATYGSALEAGATPVREPIQEEGDPDRRGMVEGPGGNLWSIATQASDSGE